MALQPTERRSVLIATGTALSTALAGCLGNALPGGSDDSSDETPATTETPDPTAEPPSPAEVINEYLQAAAMEDEEALADVIHESSPFHPSNFEDSEWEFEGSSYEGYQYSNATIVNEDASIEEIRGYEGIEFWFQDRDLQSVLGDTELQVVSVDVESESQNHELPDRWIFAKDDGEWRIFWAARKDDTPDDPEEALDEEILDDDNDVVENIEWDVDAVDHRNGDHPEEYDYAKVHLTDSPGLEAERVVIESTIAGAEFEFFSREEGEPTTSWTDSWANVQINPEGDQIVVTAIQNDSEEIVHREHYEPGGTNDDIDGSD